MCTTEGREEWRGEKMQMKAVGPMYKRSQVSHLIPDLPNPMPFHNISAHQQWPLPSARISPCRKPTTRERPSRSSRKCFPMAVGSQVKRAAESSTQGLASAVHAYIRAQARRGSQWDPKTVD